MTKKQNFFKFFNFKTMTDKQNAVVECLEDDLEMPTRKIIDKISKKYYNTITVSKRQIQRIRRHIRTKLKRERNGIMKDVFDTGKKDIVESQNIPNALQWEVDMVSTVNDETDTWTVQELSTSFGVSEEAVREAIKKLDTYIKVEIKDSPREEISNISVMSDEESAGVGIDDFETEIDEIIAGYIPPATNKREDMWEVEIECVETCGKTNKSVDVFMHKEAKRKALLFMKWAGAREWLAYLVGEKLQNGSYVVTDLYLPDQRTSAALVDDVDADEYNQHSIIGVIHSHHEMGAGDEDNPSFSGHDAAFINGNHNLSLLAGRDRKTGGFKIVGIGRATTPCGALMKVKANVKNFKTKTDKEAEDILRKSFFEKTQTKVAQYVTHYRGRASVNGHPVHFDGNGNGVSGITQRNGKTTYHFGHGGWPGNQFNQGGCRKK
jgi:hypothetical protein